jgi:hypothetical protein
MRGPVRIPMMLLLRSGYRPELLIVVFFFPENNRRGETSFLAMLGAAVLPVNHRPQPTDVFSAQEAKHKEATDLFFSSSILTATSRF